MTYEGMSKRQITKSIVAVLMKGRVVMASTSTKVVGTPTSQLLAMADPDLGIRSRKMTAKEAKKLVIGLGINPKIQTID